MNHSHPAFGGSRFSSALSWSSRARMGRSGHRGGNKPLVRTRRSTRLEPKPNRKRSKSSFFVVKRGIESSLTAVSTAVHYNEERQSDICFVEAGGRKYYRDYFDCLHQPLASPFEQQKYNFLHTRLDGHHTCNVSLSTRHIGLHASTAPTGSPIFVGPPPM